MSKKKNKNKREVTNPPTIEELKVLELTYTAITIESGLTMYKFSGCYDNF